MSLLTLIVDNVVVQFAAWSQMDEVESLTKEKKYIYIYIIYYDRKYDPSGIGTSVFST